jgi:hypothetical protein
MPNANPDAMLFRCVGDGLVSDQPDIDDPNTKCWEPGKVYLFDSEPSKMGHCFERVAEPPRCLGIAFSKLVETCDAFIKWMNGPARELTLDWEVPDDYKARTVPGEWGRPVGAESRPASASEIVEPRIRWLYDAASGMSPPPKARFEYVRDLDAAVREVERLKDLVKMAE